MEAEFCSSCWGRSWKTRRQTSTDTRLESVVHKTETGESQGCGEFGLAFWRAIPGTRASNGWSTVCYGCSEMEQNIFFFNVDCESFHRQEVSRMTWATSTDEIWGSVLRLGQGSPDGDSLGLRGSISLLNEEKRDSQMLGTEQVLAAGEPSGTRGQQWADWQVKKKNDENHTGISFVFK